MYQLLNVEINGEESKRCYSHLPERSASSSSSSSSRTTFLLAFGASPFKKKHTQRIFKKNRKGFVAYLFSSDFVSNATPSRHSFASQQAWKTVVQSDSLLLGCQANRRLATPTMVPARAAARAPARAARGCRQLAAEAATTRSISPRENQRHD